MQSFHFDNVDSTNEAAKRLLRDGTIREDAFILAREQTAGRGTRGRTWASPKDAGIYLTVVQPAGGTPARLTTDYTRAAGVACARVLAEATGLPVRIKPVNDLYLHGRKLGGILTETVVQNGSIQALITGVGINVRVATRNIADGATEPISLEEALGPIGLGNVDIKALVAAVVSSITKWQNAVRNGDDDALASAWTQLADQP
ncbi:MAG: biotin--[acetyl-CoA-carboxylase] ligase [Phycisphaerae bacterium]|nr:biotin--[acetyl-CoA-carboxylase] ligase [Phycisphaerae bacterium]